MTNARPKAWLVLLVLLLVTSAAQAGRKRIVVLDFEGNKAEKFHADVVKLIKKSNTVVSTEKWNSAADGLAATKLSAANVKKVAKKLRVDGVVTGTIEKRRDDYIIRLTLRDGSSGERVGAPINVKSESPKLDSQSTRDVKDELIGAFSNLSSSGGGGDDEEDEEEETPKKATRKAVDDEEEEAPKRSGFGSKKLRQAEEEEEEAPPKKTAKEEPKKVVKEEPKKVAKEEPKKLPKEEPKKAEPKKVTAEAAALTTKKDDEKEVVVDDDEEEQPKPKPKAVAEKDGEGGDDDGGEVQARADDAPMDAARKLSAGERAIDVVVGASFTGRRMSFALDEGMIINRPAGYKQTAPAPGVYFDTTVYPLAVGHKPGRGALRGLGFTIMFDRALALKSRNPEGSANLTTKMQRYAFGAAYRYPLGSSATSPVIGATLTYGKQEFSIDGESATPDVGYSMLEPEVFFRYPLSAKMIINIDAGAMLALDAGEIVDFEQYGRASITGVEASFGLDYALTRAIFARGAARFETLGYRFEGIGMKSAGVSGARDTYYGGVLTLGYLF